MLKISTHRSNHAIVLLTVLFVIFIAAPAHALHPSHDASILDGLAHASFDTREATTEKLLTDPDLSDEDLARIFKQAQLPEQQHRLLKVAQHVALRRMRIDAFDDKTGKGAIGIRHEAFDARYFPEINQPGLLVIKTFTGFPGHAYLRPGDIIVAIDGRSFPPGLDTQKIAAMFIGMVQSHGAGTLTRFTVIRNGHETIVQFHLAGLDALQGIYGNGEKLGQPFRDGWETAKQKLLLLRPTKIPTLPIEIPAETGDEPDGKPPA